MGFQDQKIKKRQKTQRSKTEKPILKEQNIIAKRTEIWRKEEFQKENKRPQDMK